LGPCLLAGHWSSEARGIFEVVLIGLEHGSLEAGGLEHGSLEAGGLEQSGGTRPGVQNGLTLGEAALGFAEMWSRARCVELEPVQGGVGFSRVGARGPEGLGGLGMLLGPVLPVDQSCLPEMIARLRALRRLCICGEVPRWRAAYASAIPDDVHIKLVKPLTNAVPCVDANFPNARVITFHPFYFSLGFKFLMSKLFKEAVICFENLSRFFMLELTVREFFYFFEVRHFKEYAQVRIYKAKLFDSLSQGDHAWHDDVLEVSGRKQLELGPDMAKVRRALNILLRFREWRWLLSEYRDEDGGLPPTEDVERWKQNCPDPDDLPARQGKCLAESTSKRKVVAKSSRDEATSSHAKNGSPSRKKPNSCPLCERQRDVDISLRSPSRLHQSGNRSGKSVHDSIVEPRAIKRGVDSASLTPLEVRLAEAKKMRESSARAKGSSSASAVDPKLSELEKKNAELGCKLSVEQARYEKKTSDLRAMISELKSSLTKKDSELSSATTDLASRKDAFFHLDRKNADVSLNYDKLMAKFRAYYKSTENSKSEATIDAHKLGYLHCEMGLLLSYD
ncbi:hypothetical protein Prudu_017010, partial [Prunus dulcis]